MKALVKIAYNTDKPKVLTAYTDNFTDKTIYLAEILNNLLRYHLLNSLAFAHFLRLILILDLPLNPCRWETPPEMKLRD